MKHLLEEKYEFDFNLLGICCHEKDYRLCWAVNSTLRLNLSKTKDDIEFVLQTIMNANIPFRCQLLCRASGKPSTWFPLERLIQMEPYLA